VTGETGAGGAIAVSELAVELATPVFRVLFESDDSILSLDDIGIAPPVIPSSLSISSNFGNSTFGTEEGSNSLDAIIGVGAMISTRGSNEGASAEAEVEIRLACPGPSCRSIGSVATGDGSWPWTTACTEEMTDSTGETVS